MQSVRPATVRGPVTASGVRVIWNEETVAIVGPQGVRYFARTDDAITASVSGRYVIGTTEGELTVVRQGGCNCGKPWLSTPSNQAIMDAALENA